MTLKRKSMTKMETKNIVNGEIKRSESLSSDLASKRILGMRDVSDKRIY